MPNFSQQTYNLDNIAFTSYVKFLIVLWLYCTCSSWSVKGVYGSSFWERMRRKGGQKLREGRGNWLTSGSPIRATIRHELHSHAHLHTRPYINIRSGRETGSALHTGPPARVISSFVGIPVGHRVQRILRKESRTKYTPRTAAQSSYVSMN